MEWGRANGQKRPQTRQKAAGAAFGIDVGLLLWKGGQGKADVGKGSKLYCPTKLADGSWCKWRAKGD